MCHTSPPYHEHVLQYKPSKHLIFFQTMSLEDIQVQREQFLKCLNHRAEALCAGPEVMRCPQSWQGHWPECRENLPASPQSPRAVGPGQATQHVRGL